MIKSYLIVLASVICGSAISFAAPSHKICFGSRSGDAAGAVLAVAITKKEVAIRTIKEANFGSYDGVYPSYNTSVQGRDGKTYLEYKGSNSDYQDVIMIDQVLLKAGTSGLLQIRARGEGFFNDVFVCRDDSRRS